MLRKVLMASGVALALLVGLFVIAGRRLGELAGIARAGADQTVDALTEQLPAEVRDRKMDHDLELARQELIDRQVALNLSRGQIDQLRSDVEQLKASVARRQRLLAEAYPVLKDAVDGQKTEMQFASTSFAMPDFQREVDDLMSQQDRETRQLKIKGEGLARLEKSVTEGERAIADMRVALETTEQEVAILKARREQAEVEETTLDMVASATDRHTAAASMTGGIDKLKQDVEKLEARNEARRHLAPVTERETANRLGHSWSRLEELKGYHDRQATEEPQTEVAENP